MPRVSRRRVLEAVGVAGALAIAGCSGESGESATATRTATPTDTATPEPDSAMGDAETLGFAPMLSVTPAHPDMTADTFLWARHVDAGKLLADIEDETLAGRLRGGWLGSGPPRYADSDAFEVVHAQPGGLPNLTFGYGEFSPAAAIEGLRGDGWSYVGSERNYQRLEYGGYTIALADTHWLVTQSTDTALIRSLVDAVETDTLAAYLGDVDAVATKRAAAEQGHYHVLERSVGAEGYAAGIAVNHAPYRNPVGVMQYAAGRTSPTWKRVEHRFSQRIVGEVRRSDFGD